jgi:hypothetical protein
MDFGVLAFVRLEALAKRVLVLFFIILISSKLVATRRFALGLPVLPGRIRLIKRTAAF